MMQKTVKQTRRSISVRGVTYDTLRQFCDDSQRSMSDVIEELLGALFDKHGMAHEPLKQGKKAAAAAAKEPKASKLALQLASERARKLTVSSKGRAVANKRVHRGPVVSPEESEAIRKKYAIPTGDESTAVMGRPSPTPVASYMKAKAAPVVTAKDHRNIRF
jgi:hypothetical protein